MLETVSLFDLFLITYISSLIGQANRTIDSGETINIIKFVNETLGSAILGLGLILLLKATVLKGKEKGQMIDLGIFKLPLIDGGLAIVIGWLDLKTVVNLINKLPFINIDNSKKEGGKNGGD